MSGDKRAKCPFPTEELREVEKKRRHSDCCCCLKGHWQPWHGRYCPHGL